MASRQQERMELPSWSDDPRAEYHNAHVKGEPVQNGQGSDKTMDACLDNTAGASRPLWSNSHEAIETSPPNAQWVLFALLSEMQDASADGETIVAATLGPIWAWGNTGDAEPLSLPTPWQVQNASASPQPQPQPLTGASADGVHSGGEAASHTSWRSGGQWNDATNHPSWRDDNNWSDAASDTSWRDDNKWNDAAHHTSGRDGSNWNDASQPSSSRRIGPEREDKRDAMSLQSSLASWTSRKSGRGDAQSAYLDKLRDSEAVLIEIDSSSDD